MISDLPISVTIDGVEYRIRNDCDYRIVLKCIKAFEDDRFSDVGKIKCVLRIFYETVPENTEKAVREIYKIVSCGIEGSSNSSPVMNWEHDFNIIAPAVSKILGYDIRTRGTYTHWWTLIGAYMEIPGESFFGTVLSIRQKKKKGEKLEKWEKEFYQSHIEIINIPNKLSKEEQEFLFSEN